MLLLPAPCRGTAHVVDRPTVLCGNRGQQELRSPRVAIPDVRDVGVSAAEIELAARPRWLQGRELHVLIFKTHLERMLPVDLREIVRYLDRGTDFIGRQESVAAQGRQSVDPESWKTAILLLLGNALDAILAWQVVQIASIRVKLESCADNSIPLVQR